MLKHLIALAACGATLAVGAVSPASAFPRDFVGTWVNTDANPHGVTRFVVESTQPNTLTIHGFGKCHPTDCDLGTTQLITYGSNVGDPNHKFATTSASSSFANRFYFLTLVNPTEISGQGFVQFIDKSGRQNYFSQEHFRRE